MVVSFLKKEECLTMHHILLCIFCFLNVTVTFNDDDTEELSFGTLLFKRHFHSGGRDTFSGTRDPDLTFIQRTP